MSLFADQDYINNIRDYLSERAIAVNLDKKRNLLNSAVITEDFYCEFLSALLNCNLKNANSTKHNKPGYDLIDIDKRIVMQVSATCQDDMIQKIKESIKKTKTPSEEEWQYYYVPIAEKTSPPKTGIPVPDGLKFNPETDILDIDRILSIAQYSGIDKLKQLSKLVDKFNGKANSGGRKLLVILISILIIIGIGLLCFALSKKHDTSKMDGNGLASISNVVDSETTDLSKAQVYWSKVLPYTKAGYYASYETTEPDVINELAVNNAFSILSFVRNYGDRTAQVENISCEVLDLQPIEEPIVLVDGSIKNNIVKLFILNNGWGDAEEEVVSCSITNYEDCPMFPSISKAFNVQYPVSIHAGELKLYASFKLDTTEVRQWFEKNAITDSRRICHLLFESSSGEKCYSDSFSLLYSYEEDEFGLLLDVFGEGDDLFSITLFSILDVDRNPSSLTFTGQEAAPVVNNTFRIETVIVPTKSCRISCRGVYSINGETQITDPYTVTVQVPQFLINYTYSKKTFGALVDEIIDADTTDFMQLNQICQKYRYDPEEFIRLQKEKAENEG